MQERVMMMNIPDIIRKRDIKREFKAAGYGSIDEVVFEPETFDGFNIVYVSFRPTTKTRVLEKRKELYSKDRIYIDICCEKTPRREDGCFQRWFLRRIDGISGTDFLDVEQENIQNLTETVERHTNLVKDLYDTYEHKLAAVEKRFENIERRVPSTPNDTFERKLAALEKRFDDCEFQLPIYPPPNDTYDRKLAALEKRFERIDKECSYITSFMYDMDNRMRAACACLSREM